MGESFEEVVPEGSGPGDPIARKLSDEIVPQDREQVQCSLEVKSSTANADAPPSAGPSDASANGSETARPSYIGKVVHLLTNGPLCSSSDSGSRDANTIYFVDKWFDVNLCSPDTVKTRIPVMNDETSRLYGLAGLNTITRIRKDATQDEVDDLQSRMQEKLLTACHTLNDDPSTSFWHGIWSPHSSRTFSRAIQPETDRYGSMIEPQDYHNPQLMTSASNSTKEQAPSTPETTHDQGRTDEEATAPGPVPASSAEEKGRSTARRVLTLFDST
ncbi:uncharacterized protein L199_006948 [Kwoniella botswanensis]|uniref:uncharacterized protein n=1 Tax=Kwoniella botswanensis TaxID=1268659 RepID=UPI00315CF83F